MTDQNPIFTSIASNVSQLALLHSVKKIGQAKLFKAKQIKENMTNNLDLERNMEQDPFSRAQTLSRQVDFNDDDDDTSLLNQPEKYNAKTAEPAEPEPDIATEGDIVDAGDAGDVGEGVGEGLETAGADVEAEGGGDPITDVVGGLLLLGGAIATGVEGSNDKQAQPPKPPSIEEQQATQAEEI
jgi:hypothetical protein